MKKIIRVLIVSLLTLSLSACVVPPYYGYGGNVSYSYGVAPQSYYWGYNSQPVMFARPTYGYSVVYDPFWGLGAAIVQGIGLGLGWALIGGGHHH